MRPKGPWKVHLYLLKKRVESDHYLKLVGEAAKILRKEKAIAYNTKLNRLVRIPFIRHMYPADPSAHVWKDGRLYVYASHDIVLLRVDATWWTGIMCSLHRWHDQLDGSLWRNPWVLSKCRGDGKEGGFMGPRIFFTEMVPTIFISSSQWKTDWNDSWKMVAEKI